MHRSILARLVLALGLLFVLPATAGAQDAADAFHLGYRHDNGLGVRRDGYAAQQLYATAARANITLAKNNLAYLWGRQNGLLEEALCLSAETLKVEPHNAYYLDTYGFILLRLERQNEAQRFFEKALLEKPDYDDALEHLGDIAQMNGDHATARSFWQRALAVARADHKADHMIKKLAGKPNDFNEHAPFRLDNNGFGKDCAMPTV